MGFGITRTIKKINNSKDTFVYSLRKKILGVENANTYLRQLDKDSIVPILVKHGASIGNNCDIESPITFHNCENFSNLIVGENVHIGKDCFFDLKARILIEDNVVISMRTTIITHIDLTKSELSNQYQKNSADVVIKSQSYIGACSTILLGVLIGDNSFVGAGSLIKDNVVPYTFVGGVPGKYIKTLNT